MISKFKRFIRKIVGGPIFGYSSNNIPLDEVYEIIKRKRKAMSKTKKSEPSAADKVSAIFNNYCDTLRKIKEMLMEEHFPKLSLTIEQIDLLLLGIDWHNSQKHVSIDDEDSQLRIWYQYLKFDDPKKAHYELTGFYLDYIYSYGKATGVCNQLLSNVENITIKNIEETFNSVLIKEKEC